MTYDAIKALNWSSLKYMARSPLEYRWRIDHPEPPKTAYTVGAAIHCLLLEPEQFDHRYALCDVRRDKRTQAYRDWLDNHPNKEPLNKREMDLAHEASAAVHGHRVALELLSRCRREEPIVWDDPATGMRCKGRLDGIATCVVDVKTGRDIDPPRFERASATYLYHGQLAFYHHGAIAAHKIDGDEMPYIIAVGKEPPWDVAVYQLKPDTLNAGRTLVLQLMRKLEECIAADMWPGVAPDLQYLDLPQWAAGLSDYELEREW